MRTLIANCHDGSCFNYRDTHNYTACVSHNFGKIYIKVKATLQINILRIGRDTNRTYAILMTNCYCLLVSRCSDWSNHLSTWYCLLFAHMTKHYNRWLRATSRATRVVIVSKVLPSPTAIGRKNEITRHWRSQFRHDSTRLSNGIGFHAYIKSLTTPRLNIPRGVTCD